MLVLMAQFGVGDHPGPANVLVPLVFVASVAGIGGLLTLILARVVPRVRRALRSRLAARRAMRAAANAERRARAMMDELCPHGWRAQITMFASASELAPDSPRGGDGHLIALDWTELGDDRAHPAVSRRVWATTINGALDAMVADRRTDETLQQIEQGALSDGAIWPDS